MTNTKKNNLRITVFGAGSFGTATAQLLADKGHEVILWARDKALADEVNTRHTNTKYLDQFALRGMTATSDLASALANRDMLFFAVPCQHIRSLLTDIKNKLPAQAHLVNLAKGIEIDSLMTPKDIFGDVLGAAVMARYAVISGPTFAVELCRGLPTAASVASLSAETAKHVQHVVSSKFFRLYTVDDITGVELAGALKNVMALAVAIADGLGFGHNTRAGLMTRCLHEMTELGVAMGAIERTFSGLSGVGDLILTCTGGLSRNRQVGLKIGKGEKITDIVKSMHHIAEGVPTAKAAYQLKLRHKIQMPNTEHVYKIIYEGMSPREAVERILARELKKEH